MTSSRVSFDLSIPHALMKWYVNLPFFCMTPSLKNIPLSDYTTNLWNVPLANCTWTLKGWIICLVFSPLSWSLNQKKSLCCLCCYNLMKVHDIFSSFIKHLVLILCFKNLKWWKRTNHCLSETLTAPEEGTESKLEVCMHLTKDFSVITSDCFAVWPCKIKLFLVHAMKFASSE
jgi:hypothetical protein